MGLGPHFNTNSLCLSVRAGVLELYPEIGPSVDELPDPRNANGRVEHAQIANIIVTPV